MRGNHALSSPSVTAAIKTKAAFASFDTLQELMQGGHFQGVYWGLVEFVESFP
jgi:hypothetical protein